MREREIKKTDYILGVSTEAAVASETVHSVRALGLLFYPFLFK